MVKKKREIDICIERESVVLTRPGRPSASSAGDRPLGPSLRGALCKQTVALDGLWEWKCCFWKSPLLFAVVC